jgi:DNA-binding MarR family transcriptional regulator
VSDLDAELLETLLTKVMRLVAMHSDTPVGDLAVTALSLAEGVLLVELLATGEVTQQQLADRLSLDKSRVSRLCSALERKNLLARRRDESNRRNLRVRITPSGAAAATRLRQTWHERHERMLAAMTPDERRALLVGLGALARGLAEFHPEHDTARESLAR